MPLVQIHQTRGVRTPAQTRALADTVQDVLVSHFKAPQRDRYQLVTSHEPGEMICLDTGLGFERTDKLVFIQVFQQGRDKDVKQGFYAELARRLKAEHGIGDEDVIITCSANTKEDWSFGAGRAQFLTGEL